MKNQLLLQGSLLVAVLVVSALPVPAQTQGPLSSASVVNDVSIGSVPWTNPGSAAITDNQHASASGITTTFTNYLVATAFPFTIPAGKQIDGIEISLECRLGLSMAGTDVGTASIKLVKGGVIQGQDLNDIGTAWPNQDQVLTYGGPSELWGLAWTAADINDVNFGVAVAAGGTNANTANPRVDWIGIKVYYSDTTPTMITDQEINKGFRLLSNPALNGTLHLQVWSDNDRAPVMVNLYDHIGRRVLAVEPPALGKGNNILSIDTGGKLPAGMYFVQVAREGLPSVVQKIFIE